MYSHCWSLCCPDHHEDESYGRYIKNIEGLCMEKRVMQHNQLLGPLVTARQAGG